MTVGSLDGIVMNVHRYNKLFYLKIVFRWFGLFICIVADCITYNFHCYIFPINNSTFTSQYPLTTHTTFVISNYNLPTPTVTYFQLTTLLVHLHLSIPWPHTPHLPYQIKTSQLPLLHISNWQFYIYISVSPDHTHHICHIKL